jgi:hypothetical protein
MTGEHRPGRDADPAPGAGHPAGRHTNCTHGKGPQGLPMGRTGA